VIHSYFGYKIVVFQWIMDRTSRIKEMSIKSTSLIDSTGCIIKADLCSGNSHAYNVIEQVLSGLVVHISLN
jgi:hypothetical protein